jgi:hypothetical protein
MHHLCVRVELRELPQEVTVGTQPGEQRLCRIACNAQVAVSVGEEPYQCDLGGTVG